MLPCSDLRCVCSLVCGFWSIFSVVLYRQEETQLFWNHSSAGSEISSLYLRLQVLKEVSFMTPALSWVYFNDKHKSWRTGDNKKKQSTSWSLHLRNNQWDLGTVARFYQALRDCRWEKGSLKVTHLPTNGARSWTMFFGTDSLLVCLPAFISDVKLDPASWWFEKTLARYSSPIQLTLSMWTGSFHPQCLQYFFLILIQNCFPFFSTSTPLFKSRKYHDIYQVTQFLFIYVVLIFVFLKCS